jgi:hypothetical protein
MRILFFIVILAWLLMQPANYIFAQKQSTPLEAQAPPKQMEIGVLAGLGYNYQSGQYLPNLYFNQCKYCLFENGDDLGISLGVLFERDFNEYFKWGASFSYVSKSIEASYIKYDTVPIEINVNEYEDRAIPFRNIADFDIALLSFQPYIKWSPYDFVFVRLGLANSLVTISEVTQNKELLKFKDTLTTGEIVDVSIKGTDQNIVQIDKRTIPGINSLQFSIEPAIGFNFYLGNQLYISPLFNFSIPLTKLSTEQPDFAVNHWRFIVEFKLALTMRKFKL